MNFPKRHELKFSFLMFANFFGIIAIFWILKTLKKGIFICIYASVIDNGLNYSLNQSAREVLFTASPSRYSAKAFIDVFVNRFAKIVALAVSMGISVVFIERESLRWLSFCILLFLVAWLLVANSLGKRFKEITKG